MSRQALSPSLSDRTRLSEALKLLFINSPFGTRNDGDWMEGKMKMWMAKLGKFPIWAIEKAVLWDCGGSEEVTLDSFVESVRLAEGYGLRERMNALERLLVNDVKESPVT